MCRILNSQKGRRIDIELYNNNNNNDANDRNSRSKIAYVNTNTGVAGAPEAAFETIHKKKKTHGYYFLAVLPLFWAVANLKSGISRRSNSDGGGLQFTTSCTAFELLLLDVVKICTTTAVFTM